ncbi:hypothetical protein [Qipengyuania qiaonensis]|uniref:Uncharacterized protein n=1 Tax=Qipengyuania qiaonensis TaxID=2867240 RepID=A0ABS7JD87_9SPHN|nr:hypothetical protein [Qipengyuania qiaonensis]MBX7482937.1 hypothetical protein [Qipengyuania qiaonensis]
MFMEAGQQHHPRATRASGRRVPSISVRNVLPEPFEIDSSKSEAIPSLQLAWFE